MKVRLNLATSPLENNRRFILTVSLAGLIGVVSLAVLGVNAFGNWRANRELRNEISRLQSEMREFRDQRHELEEFFKLPATRQAMDRAGFLNALIEQRSFPWTRIFSDLEHRLPEGVRVVTIAPRMQDGRVHLRLVVGASSDETKVKFIKMLESASEFSSLQVVAESRPKSGEEMDRVQVELAMVYAATERVQDIAPVKEEKSAAGEAEPAEKQKAVGQPPVKNPAPLAQKANPQPAGKRP